MVSAELVVHFRNPVVFDPVLVDAQTLAAEFAAMINEVRDSNGGFGGHVEVAFATWAVDRAGRPSGCGPAHDDCPGTARSA